MDLDNQVNGIVQKIVSEITVKVQAQVADTITTKINEIINAMNYTELLSEKLDQQLNQRLAQINLDTNSIQSVLNNRVEALAQTLCSSVSQQANETITNSVQAYVRQVDMHNLYQSTIISSLSNGGISFPSASIPYTALDFDGMVITGDHIQGGIIKHFGSTGIDDKAENCQLTIMDDITVVENNLLTKDLTVKGTTTIEGDLNVTGTLPEDSPLFVNIVNATTKNVRNSLDTVVFTSYADLVTKQITDNGLDLNKITLNGEEVLTKDGLGSGVLNSNLQKVGQLKELQVAGETWLADTLYISSKRVGVNTIEPNQALSVWDQEVEIGAGKLTNNTAVLGTPRNQTMVLSSNGKNNLSLTPDGAVALTTLLLSTQAVTSSSAPPTNDQPRGTIVFNANPTLGGPIGWVSLGDARWGNFGIID